MNGCLVEYTDEKKFNEALTKSPYVINQFKMAGCPHCESVGKILDNTCKELGSNSPVKFISCDVTKNKWCKENWLAAKPENIKREDYGVPVLVGLTKGFTINKPAWNIIGENMPKITEMVNSVKNSVLEWRKGSNKSDNNSYDQRTQSQHIAPPMPQAAQMIAEPPIRRVMKLQTQPMSYQPLCLPPKCDKQTASQSIIRYILD